MKEAIKQEVLKIQKGIQKGRNAKKEAENTKKELLEVHKALEEEKSKMQEETKEYAKNLKKELLTKQEARNETENAKNELLAVQKAQREEKSKEEATKDMEKKEEIAWSPESTGRGKKEKFSGNNRAKNVKNELLKFHEAIEEEKNGKWKATKETENIKKKKELLKVQKVFDKEKTEVKVLQTEMAHSDNWKGSKGDA